MVKMLNLQLDTSLVPIDQFRVEAGLSARALDAILLTEQMFAVELNGQTFVPSFYLDKRYGRRRLASVSRELGGLSGGSKLQFFTTPKGSLGGRTPLEALAGGDAVLVRRAAQGFVER